MQHINDISGPHQTQTPFSVKDDPWFTAFLHTEPCRMFSFASCHLPRYFTNKKCRRRSEAQGRGGPSCFPISIVPGLSSQKQPQGSGLLCLWNLRRLLSVSATTGPSLVRVSGPTSTQPTFPSSHGLAHLAFCKFCSVDSEQKKKKKTCQLMGVGK